jgi:hypothetical protein
MDQDVERPIIPHERIIRLSSGGVVGCKELTKDERVFKSLIKAVEMSDLRFVKQALDLDIASIRDSILIFEDMGDRERVAKATRALRHRIKSSQTVDKIFTDHRRKQKLLNPPRTHDGRSQVEVERDAARKEVERLKAHIKRLEEDDFCVSFYRAAKVVLSSDEIQKILLTAGLADRVQRKAPVSPPAPSEIIATAIGSANSGDLVATDRRSSGIDNL